VAEPGTTANGPASSETAEQMTHLEPLDDPDCSTAVELVAIDVGQPTPLVVAETTNGQWFCVGAEPLGLDSSPEWLSTPTLTDSGSLMSGGVFHLFVLPADTPRDVTLRDEVGAIVPTAQSLDGDHLIILDIDVDANAMPDNDVERRWELVAADGSPVLTLMGRGPAAGSAPASPEDLVACLADQGVAPGDPQPYAPEVAQAAWAACADVNGEVMAALGASDEEMTESSRFIACMAEQGWLQTLVDFATVDIDAHNAASIVCVAD
jgi:hypothetical protein